MKRLIKFIKLSNTKRWLLLEAVLWLSIAQLAILILPFRRIVPYLGTHQNISSLTPVPIEHRKILLHLHWAIETVACYVFPWKATCLPQAIAAKFMLRRRGIDSTLYFGVMKENKELKAHAWLRVGDFIVTGERDRQQFKQISTFA